LDYQEIIHRRRALKIEPFKSLAEVGFDGPWVTPYQITSKSSDGPVLVALHWLDESSILRERATAEPDFRRDLLQELMTAEKVTDDDIAAEIDKFKP
jgi:hypothetical protein